MKAKTAISLLSILLGTLVVLSLSLDIYDEDYACAVSDIWCYVVE